MLNTRDVKVLVVQMGARHNYELARSLHRRGALSGLYTDAAWSAETPIPSLLLARLPAHLQAAVRRRTVHCLRPGHLASTILPNLIGSAARIAGLHAQRRCQLEDQTLGAIARSWGLRDANIILNTIGNGGLAFLRWAKQQGAKVATDMIITPLAAEIHQKERELWPGWEAESYSPTLLQANREHVEELIEISDLLLCPSDAVVDGLSAYRSFDLKKVANIRYPHGAKVQPGHPIPRRVLFAGEAGLRKGIPYLGLAAIRLKQLEPGIEVVVAGHATELVMDQPESRELKFLGHLGRSDMHAQISKADVFCLPSLAEGSAIAVLEALAQGVPCVVTAAAGTTITNSVEGFIVPERDPATLADAIWAIVSARDLRRRMGAAALRLAQKHDDQAGSQLYEALQAIAPLAQSPCPQVGTPSEQRAP